MKINFSSGFMGNQGLSSKDLMHPTSSTLNQKTKCRVKGCKEQHSQHFCRYCKDSDSDHFSADCAKNNQISSSFSGIKCQVYGCKENHTKHYCKVCHHKNSNHLAKDCPKGVVLYHGTKYEYALSISKSGFVPSKDGCLGPGVYFTPDLEVAKDIAKGRSGGAIAAVIECRLDQDNDDVQDRMHGPWFNSNQFKEYVVKPNFVHRIKIVKIHKI